MRAALAVGGAAAMRLAAMVRFGAGRRDAGGGLRVERGGVGGEDGDAHPPAFAIGRGGEAGAEQGAFGGGLLVRGFGELMRGAGLLDGAFAAGLVGEKFFGAFEGELGGFEFHRRLREVAVGGGLQLGELEHLGRRFAAGRAP